VTNEHRDRNGGHSQWHNPYPKGCEDDEAAEWDRLEKSFRAMELHDVYMALSPSGANYIKFQSAVPKQ